MGMWGRSGSGDGEFQFPQGIAIGENRNVYVADRDNNRMQKFTSTGQFILSWGGFGHNEGKFFKPVGVAVDSNFDVYVVDSLNNRVQKFDPNGKFIKAWGKLGTDEGEFNLPQGIAIESDNDVLVTDLINHRIQKFKSDSEFIRQWGGRDVSGQHPEQFFDGPNVIAVDSEDNNYVTDTTIGGLIMVKKFSPTGNFLGEFQPIGPDPHDPTIPPRISSRGIAVFFDDPLQGNNVMVADTDVNRVQEWSRSSNFPRFAHMWGSKGSQEAQFLQPSYIAIARHTGNLPPLFSSMHYVSDTRNNRIQMFRWELAVEPGADQSSGESKVSES